MTTLTWRGNIVDDNYLFTSHENSWYEKSGWDDEDAMDYRLELDDIKEECQEIAVENEELNENYCEHGMDPEYYENRWKDSLEIECFLKEFCYEMKEIMASAKREYAMFWQGELKVNDVIWKDEEDNQQLHLYKPTYGSMGSENWWRLKYKDEIEKYDISILQQRIFKNTDFQLEIDCEFEREKLKFNKDTMRVEYDGKDFQLSKRWETSGGSKNFDVHVRVKDKKDVDWIPDRDMKP